MRKSFAKRPASANGDVRKRPASANAEGIAKRPAQRALHNLQKYSDFAEEHGYLPRESSGTPGYQIAKAYRRTKSMQLDDEARELLAKVEAKRDVL